MKDEIHLLKQRLTQNSSVLKNETEHAEDMISKQKHTMKNNSEML